MNIIKMLSNALNIASMFEHNKEDLAFLIITTPEHMYRSIKAFRKVGFMKVGQACHEISMFLQCDGENRQLILFSVDEAFDNKVNIFRLAVVLALQSDAVSATEGCGPAGLAVVWVPVNRCALC